MIVGYEAVVSRLKSHIRRKSQINKSLVCRPIMREREDAAISSELVEKNKYLSAGNEDRLTEDVPVNNLCAGGSSKATTICVKN